MSTRPNISFMAIICLSTIFSCSVKKYIPENEQLYTGSKLKLETETSIVDIKQISSELNELLRPEPNSKFLGIRIGLWAHYKNQKEKPGFINRFLNKKIGEKPVYFSAINVAKTSDLILNRLENRGFFYSSVNSEVNQGEQFTSVDYVAKVSAPYTLLEYQIEIDSLPIYQQIRSMIEESTLDR
jgi:outer membrane protein insertion porin family